MSQDLTRWNRAGLRKFRYVDGNAATYLEMLRQALANRFPSWEALDVEIPGDETASQRLTRLEQQYIAASGEWGWEIARSFARASHVLTDHLDAYANEGYLGTATQWDNVRRLVAMIGYIPAPPASASTPLVLLAKKDEKGKVAKGLQVAHAPGEGAPVVFETLADIQVDARLNALRISGWNTNSCDFSSADDGSLWQLSEDQQASVGELALLHDTASDIAMVISISAVTSTGLLTLAAENTGEDWDDWILGDTELLLGAEDIRKPQLNGSDVVAVGPGHGFHAGDMVAWQESGSSWQFNTITEADAKHIRCSGNLPASGKQLYRLGEIEADAGGDILFPEEYEAVSSSKTGAADGLSGYWPKIDTISESYPGYGYSAGYNRLNHSSGVGRIYLVAKDADPVTAVAAAAASGEFVFPGKPGNLRSDKWVIGETTAGNYQALQISEVQKREDEFTLTFVTTPSKLIRLYGPFKEVLDPLGSNQNPSAVSESLSIEWTGSEALGTLLPVGKLVLLEQVNNDGETVAAHKGVISSVDNASHVISLDTTMPEASVGFTLGNTLLRGNVVLAGHGESKPAKVLGSGDATRSFQSFVLKELQVSFLADASQSSGVRAGIVLTVGDETWNQTSTLTDSKPDDSHFTVQMTEDGELRIQFGDGSKGRRLPTGSNNLRVSYRKGTGLTGNVKAGGLSKLLKPHAKLESVHQPLDASGGNDRETLDSLRDNAPGALFTLERAVSVTDYANLAARHSSVWQARAFALPHQGRQQDRVEVVVVPAGGGVLGDLGSILADYLQQHGLPGVVVQISNHQPLAFDLDIELQVDSNKYKPDKVMADVKQALLDAFSLRKRLLGQALYRSEIYQIVEGVTGVENSQCRLGTAAMSGSSPMPLVMTGPSGTIRLIRPQPPQVLVLDKSLSSLSITAKEFEL